jgi:hypothetical protein
MPFFRDYTGVPMTIPVDVFNARTAVPFTLDSKPPGRCMTMSTRVPGAKGWLVRIKSPVREKSLEIPLKVRLFAVNSTSQRRMNLFCFLLFAMRFSV